MCDVSASRYEADTVIIHNDVRSFQYDEHPHPPPTPKKEVPGPGRDFNAFAFAPFGFLFFCWALHVMRTLNVTVDSGRGGGYQGPIETTMNSHALTHPTSNSCRMVRMFQGRIHPTHNSCAKAHVSRVNTVLVFLCQNATLHHHLRTTCDARTVHTIHCDIKQRNADVGGRAGQTHPSQSPRVTTTSAGQDCPLQNLIDHPKPPGVEPDALWSLFSHFVRRAFDQSCRQQKEQ